MWASIFGKTGLPQRQHLLDREYLQLDALDLTGSRISHTTNLIERRHQSAAKAKSEIMMRISLNKRQSFLDQFLQCHINSLTLCAFRGPKDT
jgi:hypothetical protein